MLIVALAELLMYRFNAGLEIECRDSTDPGQYLEALGLEPDALPELVDRMPSQVFGHKPEMGLSSPGERR